MGYYAYCLAQQALMERDYEGARGHLEDAVRADPSSSELPLELARVYLGLQRANDALEQARRAAALAPGAIEPRRFIVDLFQFELSRNEAPTPQLLLEAIEAHQELLKLDPGDTDARLGLARIHYAQGSYSQTIALLEGLVEAHPEAVEAAQMLARALSRAGSPTKAREVLEAAAAARPDLLELRASLAEARELSGDLAGAEEILRALAADHPERSEFRFALVRVQERRGDHAGAARSAAGLVAELGNPPPGSREEADLRTALLLQVEAVAGEDLRRAQEIALEAERRFPGEDRFALKRAEILFLLEKDDAAEEILGALASRPGSEAVPGQVLSLVFLRAGARMERESDRRRAEHLLRRAIQMDSENHAAMNYLGYMLAERNEKLDEALQLVQKALELDSANGAYLDSLGWTLYRLGRLDEAEESLRRAAESIPEEPVVREHLGDLYWARGRQAEAVQAWETALKLGIEEAARVKEKIREAGGTRTGERPD